MTKDRTTTNGGLETSGQDRLQEAAGTVADRVTTTAQQQVGTRVDSQLTRAGDVLEQLAGAVRRSGAELRGEQPQIAGLADTAAGQVERASEYLRRTDMQGLIREADRFARQQPALFIGGALMLGLVASRFLKASPQGTGRDSYERGFSRGYGYAGSGYGMGDAGTTAGGWSESTTAPYEDTAWSGETRHGRA